jgi:hypothetical protein
MSKPLFPYSAFKQAKANIGYRERVEKMEATLKARYGDAYKRWPEDYKKWGDK